MQRFSDTHRVSPPLDGLCLFHSVLNDVTQTGRAANYLMAQPSVITSLVFVRVCVCVCVPVVNTDARALLRSRGFISGQRHRQGTSRFLRESRDSAAGNRRRWRFLRCASCRGQRHNSRSAASPHVCQMGG